ncbi:sodium-dependent lysophosphatidylcholine symporter 1-B-like [Babylonia areolata]|uniref:sodium-dependent lysophosphatidylcholine symporter 1-B-like n=1 Tax=Babylonia areolata TaxID=304850 RepID=UPI003FD49DDA
MGRDKYLRMHDAPDVGEDDPLPLWRKLCFALGGVPYQMTSTVIGFFLNIYLLEVAELKPSYVAIVLFTGKAWDAVTDPTCGYFVQRTRTRWGRMRPWILFTAPFACAVYFLLFYVPGGFSDTIVGKKAETEMSMEGKLGYYLAVYCAFEGLLSCLHVPYTALTMSVTVRQKERDSVTAYRMGFEAIGVMAAVLIQGQLVTQTRCNGEEEESSKILTADDMRSQEMSYRIGSFIVIGLYLFCSVTVFLGVKEKEATEAEHESEGFFSGLTAVLTYGPFIKASMIFLFLWLCVGVIQGNILLYCTHSLKMGDKFSMFLIVSMSVSIVFMPAWQFVVLRFGKKTAYAAGLMLLVPTNTSLMYLPEDNVPAFMAVIVCAGLGISVAMLLPWSVLPDVLDLFMLEKKMRKDAIFYALYVFFNKLAVGFALAFSQMALAVGGYETGKCEQSEEVGRTLRLLLTPGPVVCLLVALICLWFYPIDETKRLQIKQDTVLYQERSRSQLTESQATMSYESITVPASKNIVPSSGQQHWLLNKLKSVDVDVRAFLFYNRVKIFFFQKRRGGGGGVQMRKTYMQKRLALILTQECVSLVAHRQTQEY